MKRILLVAISAFALVACGNSDEPAATSNAAPTSNGAPSSNAPSVTVAPGDQPEAAPPVAEQSGDDAGSVEGAGPNGPIDWNTEELPESNSIPDVGEHKPYSDYPICLGLTSTTTTDAIASLPQYFPGEPWIATQLGDDCAPFTWVRADTGGTAASPSHILFFAGPRYDYLGTATLEPYAFTSVTCQSADTVTVEYRWPVGDDANANPTGGPAVIQYQWDGSQVNMIGTLPSEITG